MSSSNLWTIPPSLALCIVALALFGISTLWHYCLLCKYRLPFWTAFVVGGSFQIIGYAGRIGCTYNLTNLGIYVIQTLFILLAPILYAASIYSLLEKLIVLVPVPMPISSKKITRIFVSADVISFFFQGAGAGAQSMNNETALEAGRDVVLVGLALQLIFFLFFIYLAILFDLRTRERQNQPTLLLRALEVSCVLILIRSIYRICEFSEGFKGYIMIHEAYFYIFDALMMFMIQIIYNLVHPGPVLKRTAQYSPKQVVDIQIIQAAEQKPTP